MTGLCVTLPAKETLEPLDDGVRSWAFAVGPASSPQHLDICEPVRQAALMCNRVRNSFKPETVNDGKEISLSADRPELMPEEGMIEASDSKFFNDPAYPMMVLARTFSQIVQLSSQDINAILELPFDRQTLPTRSYLVREGEVPTQCTLLVSGFAVRQKLNRKGARQILSLHIPGEALDLNNLFLEISDHSVQTVSETDVAIIPKQAFLDIFHERSTIARAITTSLSLEASISREWLVNIGRRNARVRLAHLLCEIAMRVTKHEKSEKFAHNLPMTQKQLGDALGLTPVHLNRMLRELEQDGLLTRNGRSLNFPDWKRLCKVAEFSANYLHFEQTQS